MIYSLLLSDQSIFNHPVHLIKSDLKKSDAKSAFIPFCQFGGNMSLMGVRIEEFEMPVCNCFEATIVNDQICYEVDLNKFSQKKNIQKELKSGFAFIMDYNEDRQVTPLQRPRRQYGPLEEGYTDTDIVAEIDTEDALQQASIYLNTIGKKLAHVC